MNNTTLQITEPNGHESRLAQARAHLNARIVKQCQALLTEAGVPHWVQNGQSTVPSNSLPERLNWFLARRKDVKPAEVDQDLQKEMKTCLEYAQAAPAGHCPLCGRKTWAEEEVGFPCNVTQPCGRRCYGIIVR